MFENIMNFFKKINKKGNKAVINSKDAAKERLHLVLMQDRANVSADFLELMKQEIIEVIKKYIDVDEGAIDVRLTNKENSDGTNGAPALYANIPIINMKKETKKADKGDKATEKKIKAVNNKEKIAAKVDKEKTDKKETSIKIEEKEEKKEKNEIKDKTEEKQEKKDEDKNEITNLNEELDEKESDEKAKEEIKSEK